MTAKIAETVARYDLDDGDFITMRYQEGTIHITAANMKVETGDEVKTIINDFMSRIVGDPKKDVKPTPKVTKRTEPKQRKTRKRFNDEQTAEIIRRYKAGEGPKAISESLGCARSTIIHLISKAGATEGRTGQHLRKPKPEPQPETEEPV